MHSTFRFSLLLAAALILSGCAAGDVGGGYASQSEKRAETLARDGEHAEAAAVYIGLASAQQGAARDRLTLLAVEQWLDAGDGRRARTALREVTKPASGDLLWLWNTDASAMYLFEGRPDKALEILEPMSQQPLTLRHRSRAEALRADAWFQKGQPARAVGLYIQRENWLDDSREIRQNQQRLWAGLLVSDPRAMQSAAEINPDDTVRGWLSLGALAASTGQQGIGWGNGVVRWQEMYAGHPAMSILQDMDLPEAGHLDFPRKIALLLPLSGKNAAAGKAIQNGFFGAYFATAAGLEDEQSVTIYDVADGGVAAAYVRAVADGAEFVVGPLVRRNVQVLAAEAMLLIPVLSLNYLPDATIAPPGFYQFALAPEDEAVSAASRAVADGAINAVALYPNNDWGRRVMNSFASELEANGGRLLDHRNYETGTQDFTIEIENVMGLSESLGRYKRLSANIGGTLQFDPRRRQDVDFVFLAADAKAGRLIKSQLKFHFAGELPVYSTSFIYSMDGQSNRDLNGVMFADTPWIIAPPPWIANYPALFNEFWPAEKRLGRLHAMGYDAYHLVSEIFASSLNARQEIIGATGRLYLDGAGKVHRRLAWAQFERGEPIPLPDPEIQEENPQLNYDIEDEFSEQPTQWPYQQLNQ